MTILTDILSLAYAALLCAAGFRIARSGGAWRAALLRVGCALAAYWVVFLPGIVIGRLTGASDLGLRSIVREALTLGNTTVPFAFHAGGYALGALLFALLARVPKPGRLFSAWLYALMPLSLCAVLRHYAWMMPIRERLLGNLMLAAGPMGAGCALVDGDWANALDARLGRMGVRARRALLLAAIALAVAGHVAFPTLHIGELQMAQGRATLAYPLDMLYAPALLYAASRWARVPNATPARRPAKTPPDGPYFGRDITDAIKGVALVMMFAHHILTFPDWLIAGIEPVTGEGFARVMRLPLAMCVPIFACLTGYFAALRPRGLRASAGKALGVMIPYWMVQALLFALSALLGARVTLRGFLAEMIGVESEVMLFNWYICFYWMAMLMLPLLMRLPHGHVVSAALAFIALPVLAATAVRALAGYDSYAQRAAQAMLDGVCALGAGVIVGQFSLYTRGLDTVLGRRRGARLALCALLLAGSVMARFFAPRLIIAPPWGGEAWQVRVSMDVLYAPVAVYALANLLAACPVKAVRAALGELGRYSMPMWLLHAAFFNVTKEALMPVLYAPGHAALVVLWGLALCYAAVWLIDAPIRWAMKRLAYGVHIIDRKGR